MAAYRLDAWLAEHYDLPLDIVQSYILRGHALVNGSRGKAGQSIRPERDRIEFHPPDSVRNRGTHKIGPALDALAARGQSVQGRICLDVGASHGGFSRALLDRGARRIYAIDVAYGIFDFELRRSEQIVLLERKNIKDIADDWFDPPFYEAGELFIVCDVSFISLLPVLRALRSFLERHGLQADGLFLLKHQFESPESTDAGVIRDDHLRVSIEEATLDKIAGLGWMHDGSYPSGLPGRRGNQETFLWLSLPASNKSQK